MALHQIQLSFNSGELSPYLHYRNDFAKHAGGAALMRNFLPMPFGSFAKRPGLEPVGETEPAGMDSKAFPFTASDGTQYVLHFTPGKLRIYRKDGTLADPKDFLGEFEWPAEYSPEWSIRAMQMVQLNDVAFFTHPSFFPLRLRTLNDTEWHLNFVPFERAPMLDENTNRNKTFTVASNPVADTWASGETYAVGNVVFTDCEWKCTADHEAEAANKPGEGENWRDFWTRMFYLEGDPVTLLSDDREEVAWSQNWAYLAGTWAFVGLDAFGDDVFDGTINYLYECTEDHEMPLTDELDADINAVGSWTEYREWGSEYNDVDDKVFHRGSQSVYICIQAHMASTHEPSVAGDWTDYWTLIGPYDAPVQWRPTEYQAGQTVARKGRTFLCLLDHYPDSTNRPGTGADWETFWEETSRMVESFAAGDHTPGQYFRISPERDEKDFQIELGAVVANDGVFTDYIVVEGGWNLFTYGTWWGTFEVQRSTNNGKSWKTIHSFQASGDRNVAFNGTEPDPAFLRLKFTKETAPSTDPETGETTDAAENGKQRAVLIPESPFVTGYCLMDSYVSADEMTGFAKTPMLSGNTYRWAEGAFSSKTGFPRTLCLHGRSLWFAGTPGNPVSYWKSRIDDFLNFETGPDDDEGIFGTLATGSQQPIRWLAGNRRLYMGTALGEWVAGSETNDLPVTPGNLLVREYTRSGSCPHQPLHVADSLFFLGRKGARLFDLAAAENNETFQALDLSRLAEHLLVDGITSMGFQQTREPCLWAVTGSGNLLSFHYSRAESISAWARHDTANGLFRDVVVFPSDSGDDEVFFIVDRGAESFLERFPQGWQAGREAGEGGQVTDGAEGETISAELTFLPVDVTLEGGTSHARRKRCHEMLLSIYQSFGGGITYNGEAISFDYSNTIDEMDSAAELRSGWIEATLPPGHVVDLQPTITHSDPYPFTVRAVILRWQLHEP